MRITKKRQRILDVLTNHHGTLSAAAIHECLPDIDLVTIYRNLDLFTKEKIVKQLYLTSGEAVYEHQAEPHHHAVCSDCERVLHFTAPDEKLRKLLNISDFAIEEIEVTVRGHCTKDKQ